MSRAVKRAIIPAAGFGSRLVQGRPYPKPLVPLGGTPLIVHVLRSLGAAGIREAVVITGHLGDRLEAALRSAPRGVALRFVRNDEVHKPNGTSVLKARAFVEAPTLLTMSDHLVPPRLYARVMQTPLAPEESLLAVDRRIAECFDLDDATKVKLGGPRVRAIGKELSDYDALDTGVFCVTPAFMEALAACEGPEGCSISQGVETLAARNAMRTVDVSGLPWLDVDTPEAHAEALRRLPELTSESAPRPSVR